MLTEDQVPEAAHRRNSQTEIGLDAVPKPIASQEEAALQNLKDVLDQEKKGSS